MTILLADPSDQASYEFDWSDALAQGETLGAVTHTVPSPLTKVSEGTDTGNAKSTVKISGALHGGLYLIQAQTTTSTGQVLNRQGTLRGFNG